jgi:oligopeptide transport system substrate-binding protein
MPRRARLGRGSGGALAPRIQVVSLPRMPCRRCWILLPVLWLMTFGVGCSPRVTPAEEGVHSRTLLLGNQSEPADLDPHLAQSFTDGNILNALFEGLTVLDERSSQPLPGAAERWQASADGLTWTFHLRPGLQWSNGDPLTARDFVYSFRRILTPALGATYAYMLWPIDQAEAFNRGDLTDFNAVGVQAPDDLTLVIRLAQPTPYLAALATHATWFPVHQASLERWGDGGRRGSAWTRPGNLVGNGSFTLAEWVPNARLVVAKNPRYWDAANTQLERVVFLPIESAEVEERAFRTGQLHITFATPPSKIPALQQRDPSPLRIDPLLNTWYLNFNTARPPLDQPRVRRALALAIDREAISRAVFNGSRLPAPSFTPPNCGGYDPRAQVPLDYAAARRLLEEAGYPRGEGLPVMPMQVLNDSFLPRVAETIQEMWQRELGVRITIEPFEQKTWLQNQQSKSHTLGLMGWVADFADPITFLELFTSENGNNWTNWSHAEYDRLVTTANAAPDATARLEQFQQAEEILLTEAPITPVVFGARTHLIHPAVIGWEPAPLGFHRFQRVRLE